MVTLYVGGYIFAEVGMQNVPGISAPDIVIWVLPLLRNCDKVCAWRGCRILWTEEKFTFEHYHNGCWLRYRNEYDFDPF